MVAEGDTVLIRPHGEFGLQDTMAYHTLAEEVHARTGSYFALVDASHMEGISAPARRWTADWTRTHQVSGCAVFGGGWLQRTIITLIVRASSLIRAVPFPVVFCASEAEARQWIARERERRQSEPAVAPKS